MDFSRPLFPAFERPRSLYPRSPIHPEEVLAPKQDRFMHTSPRSAALELQIVTEDLYLGHLAEPFGCLSLGSLSMMHPELRHWT